MTQSENPFHFEKVGELISTNPLRFTPDTPAMDVAIELLSSHQSGGPVVNESGLYLGFISEVDILKAIDRAQDLKVVTAQNIMNKDRHVIHDSTPIQDAIRLMVEHHILNLSVEDSKGVVTKTFSRHDLLRGHLGVDLGIDEE